MGSEGPRFKPRGKSFQNGAAFVPCTLRGPGFYSAALSVWGMRLLESPTFRHLDNVCIGFKPFRTWHLGVEVFLLAIITFS